MRFMAKAKRLRLYVPSDVLIRRYTRQPATTRFAFHPITWIGRGHIRAGPSFPVLSPICITSSRLLTFFAFFIRQQTTIEASDSLSSQLPLLQFTCINHSSITSQDRPLTFNTSNTVNMQFTNMVVLALASATSVCSSNLDVLFFQS
jgi:hypothetical protein